MKFPCIIASAQTFLNRNRGTFRVKLIWNLNKKTFMFLPILKGWLECQVYAINRHSMHLIDDCDWHWFCGRWLGIIEILFENCRRNWKMKYLFQNTIITIISCKCSTFFEKQKMWLFVCISERSLWGSENASMRIKS